MKLSSPPRLLAFSIAHIKRFPPPHARVVGVLLISTWRRPHNGHRRISYQRKEQTAPLYGDILDLNRPMRSKKKHFAESARGSCQQKARAPRTCLTTCSITTNSYMKSVPGFGSRSKPPPQPLVRGVNKQRSKRLYPSQYLMRKQAQGGSALPSPLPFILRKT